MTDFTAPNGEISLDALRYHGLSPAPRLPSRAEQQLRWYASHGTPGTLKAPGMTFASGGTMPTPEDTAAAHALLDELGIAR